MSIQSSWPLFYLKQDEEGDPLFSSFSQLKDVLNNISGTVNVSKFSNTFLFMFSNKILVTRAGSHKMLGLIANREDPDQTVSLEAV